MSMSMKGHASPYGRSFGGEVRGSADSYRAAEIFVRDIR